VADKLLEELFRKNEAFFKSKEVSQSLSRALERAKEGQHPKVALITCSDSRVVPEFFLSSSIGEVFVIRNAGNVLSEEAKATLYYAVKHLHVSHILVVGHESCGAVTAAFKGVDERELEPIFRHIRPHIEGAGSVEEAVKRHASLTAEEIRELPFVKESSVAVVPLYYFLDGRLEPI